MEQLMKQMETVNKDVGMSYKSTSLISVAEIIHETVKSFIGEKNYMATGDLSNENTKELDFITYANRPSRADLTAKKGDVVLARMKATNKVLLVQDIEADYIYSTGFIVLRPSKVIDNNYLLHFLQSSTFQDEKDKLCTGATQKAINNQNFAQLQIPLPPLPIQKRIAEILDAADALKRKDQELLKKYDELAQAIFIDMFGDPVKNEVKVSDIIAAGKNKIRSGPFGSDLLHSEFVDEGIFVLGIDNVVNNKFEINRGRFITKEKFNVLSRYQVFPGDVLISVMATIGRTAVVPKNIGVAINSKHLAAITPNSELINSIYFSYLLAHSEQIRKQIKQMSKGAIMDGLNLGIIKDLKFNLPPISQQIKFAQILHSIEMQKELLNKEESNSLFQTLIQKAFKGELVA